MKLITDDPTPHTQQVLTIHKYATLFVKAPDGTQFARFFAPKGGWTSLDLWQVHQLFPPQWREKSIDSFLGNHWIGSNHFKE